MAIGFTRLIISFILTFVILLLTFPLVTSFITEGVDTVTNTLVTQDVIDRAWNASLESCAAIHNTTTTECEQFLANQGITKESYYLGNTELIPISQSWIDALVNSKVLMLLIALSLTFSIIHEAGGGRV